jgi:hypothetical protein
MRTKTLNPHPGGFTNGELPHQATWTPFLYIIYIDKQGWKSIHNTYKACQSECKHTKKGKQRSQKTSNNKVEGIVLKGHPLSSH